MSVAPNAYEIDKMMMELNESQREAAQTVDGQVLVIAGAGSGKTKSLIVRIANMHLHGIKPYNIFCATFTNKAAKEMKERLRAAVGDSFVDQIWMGTFHSLCVRILRKHGHFLGYSQKNDKTNFTIYDTGDCLKLIERIYKHLGVEDKYKAGLAVHYIDHAKNNLWDPDFAIAHAEKDQDKIMAEVYKQYSYMMKESNAMDFGDLIMNTVILLRDYEEVQSYWQQKFTHV